MSGKNQVTTGEWLVPRSPQSMGLCLAETAYEIAGHPIAVVVRYPITETTLVIAVSAETDRRMLGMRVSPDSAVGQACIGGAETQGRGAKALFGDKHPNRRQREKEGVVIPIRDRDTGVGALVVFAPPEFVDDATTTPLTVLANEAGPPLRAAVETPANEIHSLIDPVTKQPTLQALEQLMDKRLWRECSLACAVVEGIETVGPGTVDRVLRHVAEVVKSQIRDYDISAHIDSGEFALFMPDTPLDGGLLVADRVQTAVGESRYGLDEALVLSCSLGVAAIPDTVATADKLLPAAELAIDEAKISGPNSVVVAHPL